MNQCQEFPEPVASDQRNQKRVWIVCMEVNSGLEESRFDGDHV